MRCAPCSPTSYPGLRQRAATGAIRATGICADVRISHDEGFADAVDVRLEHYEGEPVRVLLPYRQEQSGEIGYGELALVEPDPARVF